MEAWSSLLQLTKDDDVVTFLRTYWIANHGFARKRGLYDMFKNHIDALGPTEATYFAIELEDAAKSYEQIVAPNPTRCAWGSDVAAGLERLANSYRVRSCRPVLMVFARTRPQEMARVVRLCESITVRYSVVGEKNPNHLERMYAEMCKFVRVDSNPWEKFRDASIFDEVPDDEEFRTRLATMEISTVTSGWREVLIHLNAALGAGELRVDRPSRVHVEHILAQSPRATALAEIGVSPADTSNLVNRLGNLTLLSSRRNKQLSNRPFSEKRAAYAKSDVFLTRELASIEQWSADQIDARSHRLAAVSIDIFPHPRRISG